MVDTSYFKRFNTLSLVTLIIMQVVVTALVVLISDKILAIPFVGAMYSIPVVFLLAGLLMLLILNKTDKQNDRGLVRVFMMIKTIKNIMGVIAGVICVWGDGMSFKHYIIVTGIFYLIYLAYETTVLFRFEKLIKNLNE